MEFIIGFIIAIGVIYCLCYTLPNTVKEVWQIIKELWQEYKKGGEKYEGSADKG